jgi:hypothetical protein
VSGSTAPSTPDDEGCVTILADEYDPSRDVSALTDSYIQNSPLRNRFVCGGEDDRAVGFGLGGGGAIVSPPHSPEGSSKIFGRSAMSFEEKKEADDVVTKTLAYFDEFCAVPQPTDSTPSVAVSSNNAKNRLQHPEWAQELSLDDDDTTTNPSLPSASTSSMGDPHSLSYQTTVASKSHVRGGAKDVPSIPTTPSQDHENFEVVLDPLSVVKEEPASTKRRWPFSSGKRDDMTDEENYQTQSKPQKQIQPTHPKRNHSKQQQQPLKLQSKEPAAQLQQSSLTYSEDSKRRSTASPAVDPVMEANAKGVSVVEDVGGADLDVPEIKNRNEGSERDHIDTKKRKPLVKRFWKSCTNLPGRAVVAAGAVAAVSSDVTKQVPSIRENQQLHLAEVDNENAVARSLDLEGQDFLYRGGRSLDFEPIAEENEDEVDESNDGTTDFGEHPSKPKQVQQQQQPVLESTASAWNSIFASITAVFDSEVPTPNNISNSSNEISDVSADLSSESKAKSEEKERSIAAVDPKRRSKSKASQGDSKNDDNRSGGWSRFKAIKKSAKEFVKPKKAGSSKRDSPDQNKGAAVPAGTSPPPVDDGVVGAITEKPKAAWKAVADPTTGKTYFYHRKTRETTWTKPAEYAQYEINLKKWMEASGVKAESSPIRSKGATEDSKATTSRSASWPTASTGTETGISKDSAAKETPTGSTLSNINTEVEEGKELIKSESSLQAASRQVLSMLVPLTQPAPSRPENDINWEKRNEVERLLKSLPSADRTKSVDQLMKEYKGREDVLLDELRTKVEDQPFDEPIAPSEPSNSYPPSSPHRFGPRTMTHVSKASANTRSSALTDRTEKVKNTGKGKFSIPPVTETFSTSTSLSSKHDDDAIYNGRASPARRVPSRVPVPRERQLMVEELTDARLNAESYEGNGEKRGRIVRGRAIDQAVASEYYDGDIETEEEGTTSAYENDTYGTDSISALSENDTDFLNRKDNFEQARRRALDDAIEREDWDLAAALSEGMRAANLPGGYERAHSSWNQSELDKFIANNDWSAVKSYIARMREVRKKSLKEDVHESQRKSKANNVSRSSSANKSIGARSQLQHKELMSESSWTSDSHSSYESDDSDSEI